MQKRQRKRWKSVKYIKITICEDKRCDPEQDLIVYLTSIISWFKLQAARKPLKTDEIDEIKECSKSGRSEPETIF